MSEEGKKRRKEGRKRWREWGREVGLIVRSLPPSTSLFIVVAISDGLTQDESGLELQRGHVGLVNLCLLSRGYLL